MHFDSFFILFSETFSLIATSEEDGNELIQYSQNETGDDISEFATQTNPLAIQSSSCQTDQLETSMKDEFSEQFSTPKGEGRKCEPKFSPPRTRSKQK